MIPGILLAAALLFPLAALVCFAVGKEDSGLSKRLISVSWIYAALTTVGAITALRTVGGISLAGSTSPFGVSGFEFTPRLFLDGRSALFLLLLGLCPPVVFTLLRKVRGALDKAQAVCAWALILGLAGVFLADSLLLFYLFWEGSLVAVYFWIGLRGRRNRFGGPVYAALLRFVLFTLAGSLPMLVSIAAVCAAGFSDPGLQGLPAAVSQLPDGMRAWVFLGFLLGFAVKLPLFGFHGWLRDTYNVAPPACRALLSAAMSKMGAFGLLLVLAPAFPVEMARFGPALQILAVVGALYGGVLMLAQDRLIDLLAYASLSHLSLLALGIFSSVSDAATATTGLSGAALLVFSHALIMAFLFVLDVRILPGGHSPDRMRLTGLRAAQPRLFAMLLLAVFASASLPGLNNFPGEVLVYFAAYKASPWLTLFAGLGALVGAAALVRFLHNVFLGSSTSAATAATNAGDPAIVPTPDLDRSETALALALAALWLVTGLYPLLLLGPVERAFTLIHALGWTS